MNTPDGVRKAKKTLEERFGMTYWVELGRKGGQKRGPRTLSSEQAKKMAEKRWKK